MRNHGQVVAAKRKRRIERSKRATKKQVVARLERRISLLDRGVRNWKLMLMKARGENKALAAMIEALQ